MKRPVLKAPFPAFGGKSRVASLVWKQLGPDVRNYIEPFCRSCAVLLARPKPGQIETVNDIDCVGPGTAILRADLSWTWAGSVSVGEKLMGFDEFNGPARTGLVAPTRYRRWGVATVTRVRRLIKPCYRLRFSDGTDVVASENHMWLAGSHRKGGRGWRWLKTKSLVVRRTQQSAVLKVANVTHSEYSYDVGWLAGIFDGEGSLHCGPGIKVAMTQNEGPILDRAQKLLRERGFSTKKLGGRNAKQLCINGGLKEALRFLMLVRPDRLIEKFADNASKLSLYGREHQGVALTKKEFLGNQEVIAIETDCHTFIAEGLASHNCFISNFWRSVQKEPEAVAKHADWPVNEVDLHARHLWLMVSTNGVEFRKRMRTDPDYYDAKIAGWWVWGMCQWIGAGWCDENQGGEKRPALSLGNSTHGRGVHAEAKPPDKIPRLTGGRKGDLYYGGLGVHSETPACATRLEWLKDWMCRLQDRLRTVRVCCGDWSRVCTSPSVTTRLGTTGIFLDPPYALDISRMHAWVKHLRGQGPEPAKAEAATNRHKGLYGSDSDDVDRLVARVHLYCCGKGIDKQIRIVLAGYAGEHDDLERLGWEVMSWKASGYNNRGQAAANNSRERLWYSPHCVKPERVTRPMFGLWEESDATYQNLEKARA